MKPLSSENYFIRPFKAFKTHLYSYTHLGTQNTNEINVIEATEPPALWIWSGSQEPINPNGIYKRNLYKSVQKLMYPTPTVLYGSASYTATGSLRDAPMFDRGINFNNISDFYVLNISQVTFGEQVYPGSVVITSPTSTASLYDDGNGRLTSSTNSGSIIGNIFYPLGIAVINKTTGSAFLGSPVSHEGLSLTTGSIITAEYKSQYTIYEHNIVCTIAKNEFNFSMNPSFRSLVSSSLGMPIKLLDALASGSIVPYMTQLGFYNDNLEMVAIAKFPRALRRAVDVDQTFIVRFDV